MIKFAPEAYPSERSKVRRRRWRRRLTLRPSPALLLEARTSWREPFHSWLEPPLFNYFPCRLSLEIQNVVLRTPASMVSVGGGAIAFRSDRRSKQGEEEEGLALPGFFVLEITNLEKPQRRLSDLRPAARVVMWDLQCTLDLQVIWLPCVLQFLVSLHPCPIFGGMPWLLPSCFCSWCCVCCC